MNYSQVFQKYEQQGWNESSKFNLLLSFLDLHSHTIVTPRLFDNYLSQVQDEEDSIEKTFYTGVSDGFGSEELTSGTTYQDQAHNEAYDHGVNVGQAIRFMEKRNKDENPSRASS